MKKVKKVINHNIKVDHVQNVMINQINHQLKNKNKKIKNNNDKNNEMKYQ